MLLGSRDVRGGGGGLIGMRARARVCVGGYLGMCYYGGYVLSTRSNIGLCMSVKAFITHMDSY
jgi:hypothetical protein